MKDAKKMRIANLIKVNGVIQEVCELPLPPNCTKENTNSIPLNEDNIINLLGFEKCEDGFSVNINDVCYIVSIYQSTYRFGVKFDTSHGEEITYFAWNITTVDRVQNLLIDLND